MHTHVIDGIEVHTSSGSVFADLALADAETLAIKTGLVAEIMRAMRRLNLRQVDAARRMGITQPKLSALLSGDFRNVSERKLMQCLNRLGCDIEIKVQPAQQEMGHLTLAMA